MSNSGMYKILASDGKQDELLFARTRLQQYIQYLTALARRRGEKDPVPFLHDIEKSHIIFFNSTFKSFVPIGTEYYRAKANAGNPSIGSEISFSIPVHGDFFADMAVQVRLSAASTTDGVVPNFPAPLGTADIVPGATSQISADEDTVNGVYTQYIQEYVDWEGNVVPVGSVAKNFVRYSDLPGIRFIEKARILINGNLLDEYSYNSPLLKYKKMMPVDKLTSYHRLIGQEVEVHGVSELIDIADTSKYPEDVREKLGLQLPTKNTRRKHTFLNGPQTPKLEQPPLEMLIPLQFWFCRDPSLAVPSIAIPYGQRFIEIKTCNQRDLIHSVPGGLKLRTTIKKLYSAGADMGTSAAVAVHKVEKWVHEEPVNVERSIVASDFKIDDIALVINNIFTVPEIHNIYLKRVGFNLVRVHREQIIPANNSTGSQQLANIKYPIEYLLIGARPRENSSDTNPDKADQWHMHAKINKRVSEISTVVSNEVVTDQTTAYDTLDETGLKSFSSHSVCEKITIQEQHELLTSFSLLAQSIKLEPDNLGNLFFRDYVSYKHGGHFFSSSNDMGVYLYNFALYPGQNQPSGHLNISRAREFFFEWISDFINGSYSADIFVVASAINFLLLGNGNAIMRYAA